MSLKIKHADILKDLDASTPTVVLHGCNCLHTMGAGIAKYLSSKYPLILAIDKQTKFADREKLGTVSIAGITGFFHIVNCYTQFDYRRRSNAPPVDYNAIDRCLENIAFLYPDWEIRSPKILS